MDEDISNGDLVLAMIAAKFDLPPEFYKWCRENPDKNPLHSPQMQALRSWMETKK